ncbi:MAG: chromosome segregation protein SMC, partial [Chitinophagaceae bacterium]
IELAKAALEGFNITYKDLNEQQQQEVDRRIELEAAIATEEAGLEQEKLAFIEKEKALQQMQHAYNEMLDKVRNKENEKNLGSQRLMHLKERKANLDEFLQTAEGQMKGLEESITFTGTQIQDEEVKLAELEDKLQDLKDGVEDKRRIFDDKRSSIDVLRKENQAIQRNQFEAEKKVAIADTSIQNLQRTIAQVQEEKSQRQTQLKQLEAEQKEKEEELELKKADLKQLQEQHEFTKEQILQTQNMMEGLRNSLAEENRKLDAKRNEHDLLKSLVDSMEGYPESVKFLHNNKGWNHTAPLLSDIIYVKEQYRAAVENVLEPYLNYYVVNNLQEGLQAVHLLDEHKKGKANFFLLDKFETAAPAHQPEGTIPALDVVEIDAQYANLAANLLGNVFIAEDEAAMHHSNGAVVLEKTGKYVKGKYSLTGGSVGLFEGKKIGRAKNLEKLQEEIAAQHEVVNKLKAEIQSRHNEVIAFNEQLKENAIRQTQQDINNLTNLVFSTQNKKENLQHLEVTSTARVEELSMQLENNHEAIAYTRTELDKFNFQLDELADKLQLIEMDYATAEQEYNFATVTFNDSNLLFAKQQSKLVSLKQELEFKSKQLSDLTVQVQNSATQLKDAAENIELTTAGLQELETLLVTMLQNKDADEKKLNEADQLYYNLRNVLTEKESELRHKQKSKEGIDHLLNEIKDKLTDLKLQLAGMKERLSVEFRVDLDEIIDEPRTGDTPLEELKEKNERMKKRLENMGEVNPTAIEAYTEMKKRYEFILEQKNDLVTAKDSLMQTIQEVEATANQQFLDTFNKVRENFQKVFKALFTDEDTADMVLVDPENLAETGIDIVAKPKGKRPSSIGQLSGGEKTLTATALLFAIYLIKPAPFCILDEVDAPLDDANVGKFTNMIKQFSENSQFIIVTHNKQTMSAVDVIYGVTMQEAGVSKLVPVDFRSLN